MSNGDLPLTTVEKIAVRIEGDMRQRDLRPGDRYLTAAEAGELFGRGLLIGHHCVKQFAPADIAAFVKSIDDAGTLQYDSNKAPLPLHVHVVMPHGELRNQAAVLDAIAGDR